MQMTLMGSRSIRLAAAAALLSACVTGAYAHHGWSWTEDGFFRLEGTLRSLSFGNPHPTLDVDVEGEVWTVELAPPAATRRAGFTEDSVRQGEAIVAIGNRSRDESEKRMKAVRIVVGDKTYDVYPGRVPPA